MSRSIFTDVIRNNVQYNQFDLSHDKKFSTNFGRLTPCLVQEVMPGDSFSVQSEQLVRLAPLMAPPLHRAHVSIHYFFVPNRLLWDGWEDFITNPLDVNNPHPYFKPSDFAAEIKVGSLADYLGYPTGVMPASREFNPLPIWAYHKLYDDYYRDQNIEDEVLQNGLIDGNQINQTEHSKLLLKLALEDKPVMRAYEKDYFTSALPWPQKGEAVEFPLAGSATVKYKEGGETLLKWNDKPLEDMQDFQSGVLDYSISRLMARDSLNSTSVYPVVDNSNSLTVDLTQATALTVEDLRRAVRIQEWLEINARGGTRYIESIYNHFGVKSSDARLQRAEYLGGGKSNISFSEVLQMSASDATSPQGNQAGHGINVGQTNFFRKSFEEHGYIIGVLSIMPETAYMNTTPKYLLRKNPFDYCWPSLAMLGEQPVYKKELKGDHPNEDDIFGYQAQYADMKYNLNTVHGDFKTSLQHWHMARDIQTPNLSGDFIWCDNSELDNIFAVTDPEVHKMYCLVFHKINARRALPKYNIPTL